MVDTAVVITAAKLDMAVDSWIRRSVTVAITAVDMNVDTTWW